MGEESDQGLDPVDSRKKRISGQLGDEGNECQKSSQGEGHRSVRQNGGTHENKTVNSPLPHDPQVSDTWICMKCKSKFLDENCKVLECEVCLGHKCAKCLKITSGPQYATASRIDFAWICSDRCRAVLKEALSQVKSVPSQLGKKMTEILSTVKSIEEKVRVPCVETQHINAEPLYLHQAEEKDDGTWEPNGENTLRKSYASAVHGGKESTQLQKTEIKQLAEAQKKALREVMVEHDKRRMKRGRKELTM